MSRAEMEAVIRDGRSVILNGVVYDTLESLPSEVKLAEGDAERSRLLLQAHDDDLARRQAERGRLLEQIERAEKLKAQAQEQQAQEQQAQARQAEAKQAEAQAQAPSPEEQPAFAAEPPPEEKRPAFGQTFLEEAESRRGKKK
jgi:ATPase subunit of ABC transporter with duplicated ATPase domains